MVRWRPCSTEESDGTGEPRQKKVRVELSNSNINQLLGLKNTTTEQLKLPSDSWKMFPGPSGNGTSLILFEFVFSSDGTMSSRKAVEVDLKERKVTLKVKAREVEDSPRFLKVFKSISELEMVLHEFNLAILCPGITDVKYHELEATTITSGVFNGTEWRATKYVYVYK